MEIVERERTVTEHVQCQCPHARVVLWETFKMAAVMNIATELCIQNENEEKNQYGELSPCRKLSPLSPYLKLEEYHMLERDKGKCKAFN